MAAHLRSLRARSRRPEHSRARRRPGAPSRRAARGTRGVARRSRRSGRTRGTQARRDLRSPDRAAARCGPTPWACAGSHDRSALRRARPAVNPLRGSRTSRHRRRRHGQPRRGSLPRFQSAATPCMLHTPSPFFGEIAMSQLVVAALSGGVDSATAAGLLVEQGHKVVGMTLRLYDARGTAASSGGRCCGPRDMEDARRVAAHLGIPFYVVDLAAEFERHVMDDFTSAYLEGKTPNPCARCNQHIKFSPLLRRARALGADVVVTGHYARLEPAADGHMRLRRAVDPDKDQSYFLFAMPADEMA